MPHWPQNASSGDNGLPHFGQADGFEPRPMGELLAIVDCQFGSLDGLPGGMGCIYRLGLLEGIVCMYPPESPGEAPGGTGCIYRPGVLGELVGIVYAPGSLGDPPGGNGCTYWPGVLDGPPGGVRRLAARCISM